MTLTAHQRAALAYIVAHPGAHTDCRAIGVRTAAVLEKAGLITRTTTERRDTVANAGFCRYGAGHHSVYTVEQTAMVTPAGRAVLA